MLNERLRMLREEKHLTQGQLAEKIGVEKSSISKYESKSNPIMPSVDIIIAIADFFYISIDYLLGRTDDPILIHTTDSKSIIASTKKELPEHLPEEPTMRMDFDLPSDLPKDRQQLEQLISSMIQSALDTRKTNE